MLCQGFSVLRASRVDIRPLDSMKCSVGRFAPTATCYGLTPTPVLDAVQLLQLSDRTPNSTALNLKL